MKNVTNDDEHHREEYRSIRNAVIHRSKIKGRMFDEACRVHLTAETPKAWVTAAKYVERATRKEYKE